MALAAAHRDYDRARRRRFAATYRRDIRVLLAWTFPASREAVTMAEIQPANPAITRALCRRLYRDLLDARALPRFFRRRAIHQLHKRQRLKRSILICNSMFLLIMKEEILFITV